MRGIRGLVLAGLLALAGTAAGVVLWVDTQGVSLLSPDDSTPSATGNSEPGLQYVALGDSFTSGYGVEPSTPTSGACARSTVNYPQLLAKHLGATLVDVSCSGADTADLFAAQEGTATAQLDALTPAPDVVTLTIGGNNSNLFAGTLQACAVAGLQARGIGSPCADQYGDAYEDTVDDDVYPALVESLEAVHARAPGAKVAILGYPSILPRETGCFDVLPVAAGDLPYVNDVQDAVNAAVEKAAEATGTVFVDMSAASDGKDLCAAPGEQWMNPATVHPNEAGHAAMAVEAAKALGFD
jgi:lysophospholipase L1-like esterase